MLKKYLNLMKMQLTTILHENKIIENLIENISIDIMNSLQTF